MKRFIIQKSESKENHFVVTDTENKLVVVFKKNAFIETQEFTELKNIKYSQVPKLSNVMREIGEWLTRYHKDKI